MSSLAMSSVQGPVSAPELGNAVGWVLGRGWVPSPAHSWAVSTLSRLSKPRHSPGSGLSVGAVCKETCKPEGLLRAEPGDESFRWANPARPGALSPAGSILALHGGLEGIHLLPAHPVAAAAEVEELDGEQQAADAEDNPQ